MGKQAPASPDYKGAAEQTGQSATQNIGAQTQANRPNQSTPFGFSSWTQGPDGSWSQQTGLNGGLGAAAGGLQSQAGQMANPMDWNQFGKLDDGSAARDQAINAAYGQATSRLDPQWAQRQQQQSSTLANQGLDPNSQAARNSNQQFSQQRNDAYGSAMNSAIMQGTQAQQATFQQNMQARQQAIAEALRQRGMPMEELMRMQGFLNMPGFQGAGAAGPTDYLGATAAQGNYNLNAWDAQNRANADAWKGGMEGVKGAASLMGPAAFALSDERAKTNVRRLDLEAMPGVPWATWEYLPEHGGARGVGVIAQDLEKVAPAFVTSRSDGLLMVDYRFLEVAHGSR